ncbi:MAG TPA: hypothetical protein P5205_02020 [Candidatus Paceibacterota bacterium]|nr:hypothetical protein [Verrucomicrobiota bacterium]HSA09123.1 hypothetical protein [Candidatus Paceibacterota bacterium]
MKTRIGPVLLAPLLLAGAFNGCTATAQPADPGWPRVFKKGKQQLTVYQPQVDYWNGYTNLHFRCAIAVKGVSKQEKFGVAEVDALTVADHTARVVALIPLKRELRFANVPESELKKLREAVEELHPSGQAMTLSLDRVIAYLNPAAQPVQPPVEVNLDPPKIFSSTTPAILVIFMGEPQFKPVETNRTDLLFALNTNWDVLYDSASRQYYLLNREGWLTTADVLNGPWTPARTLPPSLYSLPNSENWAEARRRLPGKPAKIAPTVFVTKEPAEMILTDGPPSYMPIRGTRLLRVNNTESVLFLHTGDSKLYFLVAGRWFRAASIAGPWSAASRDLPLDFAQIPDDDPAAFVKASVPGTREAQDAVLLASVPSTTTVQMAPVKEVVTYSGAPQFVTIPSTTVQYAVNTPNQVFLVSGGYYWCYGGAWLTAPTPSGPWTYCTSVPAAIYTIPPSNPNYNVTYVVVQSSTPTTVVYSQTSGYSGQYVAATGVLMFGMGMLAGAAIADHHHDDYYYPPPCHYSYGCGAVYHHGYGGYYASAHVSYGPYGGAGRTASYNPYTGTYARSSYAYGPYGNAARGAAYNPYTGTSAAGRTVSTPYGTARQGAAYNPYTGARAAGGSVSTAYGSAGRGAAYNPTTGQGAAGRYASGAYGSAGAVRTTEGSGMVAWDTKNSQGSVGKTQSGDVYAAKDGTVYKKDSDGGWSQNSGSGWESTTKPQPAAAKPQASSTSSASRQAQASSYRQQPATSASSASSSWSRNQQSMESQAQARQYGNRQSQKAQSWQSSGGSRGSSFSGSRSGGGGRRR